MKFWKAETMKYRHTFLKPLAVGMPLVCILLAAVLTAQYFVSDAYNWWYMMLYPGTLAVICGMIGSKDRKQGNRTIASLPVRQGRIWDAKLLTAAAASGISMGVMLAGTLLLSFLLEWGLGYVLQDAVTIPMQLLGAAVIWFSSLWQIPLCLWMTQRMGVFAMFLLHMVLYIGLSATVSLQTWFWMIPAAITPRLTCVLLKILPNGLPAAEGSETFRAELLSESTLPSGLLASVVWFVLLWLLGRALFERRVQRG